MTENNNQRTGDDSPTISRRSVLQGAKALGGGAAVGTALTRPATAADCGISESSGSETEDDYVDKAKDTAYDQSNYRASYYDLDKRSIELRSSVVYNFSQLDGDDRWQHWFYGGSVLHTKEAENANDPSDWNLVNNISYHEITIENLDTSLSDFYYTQSDDVGGAPDDGPVDLDVTSATFTAAKIALSADPRLAIPLGAFDVANALIEGDSDSGSTQTFNWGYEAWNLPCQGSHYANFMFRSEPGEDRCHFSVDYEAGTSAPSMTVNNGWSIYIDVYDDPNIESATTSSGDHPTTEAEYRNHPDMVKVPTESVPKHPEANYPDDGVWIHTDPSVRFEPLD